MNDIFKLIQISDKQVVLEVTAETPLDVAMHPYISLDYKYITVTRGENHTLTIVRKNGSTFSYDWGAGGYTLVSSELDELRRQVTQFIKDNHIIFGATTDNIYEASLFYNSNYRCWQVTVNRNAYLHFPEANSAEETIAIFERDYLKESVNWRKTVAVTGIDVWEADI